MNDTYSVSISIKEDLDNAPSFSIKANNLSRAQLEGFLCLSGGYYDDMVAATEDTTQTDEDEQPHAE